MKNEEHACYKEMVRDILPDLEQVRRNVINEAEEYKSARKKSAWFIPAVACACAAIVICTAVPPVKAAIAQWFRENFSIGNYVAQPAEARPGTPELEAVIQQSTPGEAEITTENSLEIMEIAPEWQEWADRLDPKVGDVYYDGTNLIVGFDMGGGAAELVAGGSDTKDAGGGLRFPNSIWMGNPGYIILNGQPYIASCRADISESAANSFSRYTDAESGAYTAEGVAAIESAGSIRFAAQINIGEIAETPDDFLELSEEEQIKTLEELGAAAVDHDPKKVSDLEGIQNVEAYIPLILTDYSKPISEPGGIGYQGAVIGKIKLSFSFDPHGAAGGSQTVEINQTIGFQGEGTYKWADWESDPEYATFMNKTVDMSGVVMTAKRMEVTLSGARLYVGITCPDNWDALDRKSFLSSIVPSVYGDGAGLYSSGEQYGLEEGDEDLGMCIMLDMLPSEIQAIDTFEITPVLIRYSGYDDIPFAGDEPIQIPQNEVQGWQEEDTALTGCTLKFSIK